MCSSDLFVIIPLCTHGEPVGFIYGDWDERFPSVFLNQTEFSLLNDLRALVVKSVGTAWSESLLTWNNKPAAGTQIGTVSVVGSTAAFYEIDITSYVNAQRAAGQPVNIVVQASQATSAAISATTGESSVTSADNRPKLVLTP